MLSNSPPGKNGKAPSMYAILVRLAEVVSQSDGLRMLQCPIDSALQARKKTRDTCEQVGRELIPCRRQ
jgi:hypothetical protein